MEVENIKAPQEYGAFNQKPLTIKPYPMKIRNEYMHHYELKKHPGNFLIWNNRVSTKQITNYPHCGVDSIPGKHIPGDEMR
jgi:hypothetical protein